MKEKPKLIKMSSIQEALVDSNSEEQFCCDNTKEKKIEVITTSKEVVSIENKTLHCDKLDENASYVIVSTSSSNTSTKLTGRTVNHRRKLIVTSEPCVPIIQLSEIQVKGHTVQFLIINQSEQAERELMYVTQSQETKTKLQEICIPKEVTSVTDFNSLKELNKLLDNICCEDARDESVNDDDLEATLSHFSFSKDVNDSVIDVNPAEIISRKLLVINQPGEAILKLINVLCSNKRVKKYVVINIGRKARRELVFFEPVIISEELYTQLSCKMNELLPKEELQKISSQLVATSETHKTDYHLKGESIDSNLPVSCKSDETNNEESSSNCAVENQKQLTQSELLVQAIINSEKKNTSDMSLKLEVEDMEINVDEEESSYSEQKSEITFDENSSLFESSKINNTLPKKEECNNAESLSKVSIKSVNSDMNLEKTGLEEQKVGFLFHNFLFAFSAHLIIVNHPGEPIIKFLFPSHVDEKNSYLVVNQSCQAERELLFVTELGEIKEQLADASKPDMIKNKCIKIIRTKKGKKKIIYERSTSDTEHTTNNCSNSSNQKKIIKTNQPAGAVVKFITINCSENKTNEVIVINMSRKALREVKIIKQCEMTKEATTFDEIGNVKSRILTIKHSGNEKTQTINFGNAGIVESKVTINNPLTEVPNETMCSGGKKRKHSDNNVFNQPKNMSAHCVSSPPRSKIVIVRSQRPTYIVSKSSSGKQKFIRVRRTHRTKDKVTYSTSSSVEAGIKFADKVNLQKCMPTSNEDISQERKRKISSREVELHQKVKRMDDYTETVTNIINSSSVQINMVRQEIESAKQLSKNQQRQLKGISLNVYQPNKSEIEKVAGTIQYSLSSHFQEVAQKNVLVVNRDCDSQPDATVFDALRKLKNTVLIHADMEREHKNIKNANNTVNSTVTEVVTNIPTDSETQNSSASKSVIHETFSTQSHKSILKYPCCSRETNQLINKLNNFQMYAIHNTLQTNNAVISFAGNKHITYSFLITHKTNECMKSAYLFCRAQEKLKLNTASNKSQAVGAMNEKMKNTSEKNGSRNCDIKEGKSDLNEINCFCQNNLHNNEVPQSNVIPGILSNKPSDVRCNWHTVRNFLWVEEGDKVDHLKGLNETLINADCLYELFHVLHDTESRENIFPLSFTENSQNKAACNKFKEIQGANIFTTEWLSTFVSNHCQNNNSHFAQMQERIVFTNHSCAAEHFNNYGFHFVNSGDKYCQNDGESISDIVLKPLLTFIIVFEPTGRLKRIISLNCLQKSKSQVKIMVQSADQINEVEINYHKGQETEQFTNIEKLIDCNEAMYLTADPNVSKRKLIVVNQKGCCMLVFADIDIPGIDKQSFIIANQSEQHVNGVINLVILESYTSAIFERVDKSGELTGNIIKMPISKEETEKFLRFIKVKEEFSEKCPGPDINHHLDNESLQKISEDNSESVYLNYSRQCENILKISELKEKQHVEDDDKQDTSTVMFQIESKKEKVLETFNIDSVSEIKDLKSDDVKKMVELNKNNDTTRNYVQNENIAEKNISQHIEIQPPFEEQRNCTSLLLPENSEMDQADIEISTNTDIDSFDSPENVLFNSIQSDDINFSQPEEISDSFINKTYPEVSMLNTDSIMILMQEIIELLFDVLLGFADQFSSDSVLSDEVEVHADIEYLYAALCKKSDSDFTKELSKRRIYASDAYVSLCKASGNECKADEAHTYCETCPPVKQMELQSYYDKSIPSKVTYLLKKVRQVLEICPDTTQRRNLYDLLLCKENVEKNYLQNTKSSETNENQRLMYSDCLFQNNSVSHVSESKDTKLVTETLDQNTEETKLDAEFEEVKLNATCDIEKEINEEPYQKLSHSNICKKTNNCSVFDFIVDVVNSLRIDGSQPADLMTNEKDHPDIMNIRYDGIPQRNPFLSFCEFRHRATTYNKVTWKNCALKVLQLAQNGWLYEQTHGLIYCDLCLEVLQELEHDAVSESLSEMLKCSHEEDCFWRRNMCPSSFLRTPAAKAQNNLVNNIHLFYKNFERFIPRIRDTHFEKMGLNITTILAITQYAGIPLNEISLAAVVLSLCGWRSFHRPLTIKCFYCTKTVECEEVTSVSQHIRNVTSEKIISTYDMAVEKVKSMLKDKKCNMKMISEMIYLEMCQMWWSDKESDCTNIKQIYAGQPMQGKPNNIEDKMNVDEEENQLPPNMEQLLPRSFEMNVTLSNHANAMPNLKEDDFDFKKPDSLGLFSSKFLKKKINVQSQLTAKEDDKILVECSSKNKESSGCSSHIVNVNTCNYTGNNTSHALNIQAESEDDDSNLKQLNVLEQGDSVKRQPATTNKRCTIVLPITVTSAKYSTNERITLQPQVDKNLTYNALGEKNEENVGVLENTRANFGTMLTDDVCPEMHGVENMTDDKYTTSKLFKYVHSEETSAESQVKCNEQCLSTISCDKNVAEIKPTLRNENKEIEVVPIIMPVETKEIYSTNRHSVVSLEAKVSTKINQQNFQSFRENKVIPLFDNSSSKRIGVGENAHKLFLSKFEIEQLPKEEVSQKSTENSFGFSEDRVSINKKENEIGLQNKVNNNASGENATAKSCEYASGENVLEKSNQKDLFINNPFNVPLNVEGHKPSCVENTSSGKFGNGNVKRVKKVIMNIEDYKSLLACRKFLDMYGTKEVTVQGKNIGKKSDVTNNVLYGTEPNSELLGVNKSSEIHTSTEPELPVCVKSKGILGKCLSLANSSDKKIYDLKTLDICDNSHLESVGNMSSHNLLTRQIVNKHSRHESKHEQSAKSVPKFLCTPAPISSVIESHTKESEYVTITKGNTKICLNNKFRHLFTCSKHESLMCTKCNENSENKKKIHFHKVNSGNDGTITRKKRVYKNRVPQKATNKNMSVPYDMQFSQNISNAEENIKNTPNLGAFQNMHGFVDDKLVRFEPHCRNLFSAETCLDNVENTQVFCDRKIIPGYMPNVADTSHYKSTTQNSFEVGCTLDVDKLHMNTLTHNHSLLDKCRSNEISNYASILLQPLHQGETFGEKSHSKPLPKLKPVTEVSAVYPKMSDFHPPCEQINVKLTGSPMFDQKDKFRLHSPSKMEQDPCLEMSSCEVEAQSDCSSKDFSPKKCLVNTFQLCKLHCSTNCTFDHSTNNYTMCHNQCNCESCCDKSNYHLCREHNLHPHSIKTEYTNERLVDDELLFSLASQFSNYNRTDISQLKQQLDTVDIMLKNIDRLKKHKCSSPDFDPINSHHFWCVWRIPTFVRDKESNQQVRVPGWHAVIFHLLQNKQFLCNPNVDPKFVDFLKSQLAMFGLK